MTITLTDVQETAVSTPYSSFLLGPAGSGKTTALRHRLLRLLQSGEPAYTLLVLVAEPDHQQPYLDFIHQSGLGPYADLKITTYIEMAREMVLLFWPLVARPAGFTRPYQPPTFLSYDLAQLMMWRIVMPMIGEGAFANLRLRPQQIVSQILDTLNRAAFNALTLEEALARQRDTWVGEPERLLHLEDAARAARAFRRQCLESSLLDLSLIVEVFDTQLVRHAEFQRYFSERYRHMLIDNVEEQTPAGQNFVQHLLPVVQTAVIAYDAGGGYKRFMAADPLGANKFRRLCSLTLAFTQPFTVPETMMHLANVVENHLLHTTHPMAQAEAMILAVVNGRYRRDMVFNLMPLLHQLIHETAVLPGEIAIITPYLDGALRYTLTQALRQYKLPAYFLRRRSSPREEPRIRVWLTWLALAHPQWQRYPATYDVAEALALSIHALDPARAHLLASRLYAPEQGRLLPVADLPAQFATRVGAEMLALVEELRLWLEAHNGRFTLDAFLYTLFAQLLSQPRFQPTPDLAGAAVCDWLVRAARRLRQSAPAMGLTTPAEVGRTFIEGIYNGLVTARPPELGEPPDLDGIMISTIYGYLLSGRPARVQVWLETAATGWWDIPNQPLSNAFILAQSRPPDQPWSTEEEFHIRHQLLSRIIRGLAVRCRDGVILANSELDRRGQRQDGILWRALQPVMPKRRQGIGD